MVLKLETISSIIKWFEENYKWFFSGLGVQILVATLTLIVSLLGIFFIRKRKANNISINGNGSQVTTGDGSHNIKISDQERP